VHTSARSNFVTESAKVSSMTVHVTWPCMGALHHLLVKGQIACIALDGCLGSGCVSTSARELLLSTVASRAEHGQNAQSLDALAKRTLMIAVVL
jgi:hypothetical protein